MKVIRGFYLENARTNQLIRYLTSDGYTIQRVGGETEKTICTRGPVVIEISKGNHNSMTFLIGVDYSGFPRPLNLAIVNILGRLYALVEMAAGYEDGGFLEPLAATIRDRHEVIVSWSASDEQQLLDLYASRFRYDDRMVVPETSTVLLPVIVPEPSEVESPDDMMKIRNLLFAHAEFSALVQAYSKLRKDPPGSPSDTATTLYVGPFVRVESPASGEKKRALSIYLTRNLAYDQRESAMVELGEVYQVFRRVLQKSHVDSRTYRFVHSTGNGYARIENIEQYWDFLADSENDNNEMGVSHLPDDPRSFPVLVVRHAASDGDFVNQIYPYKDE